MQEREKHLYEKEIVLFCYVNHDRLSLIIFSRDNM